MPLLILDRDGVINQDADEYIRRVEDWIPIPGSIEAIASLSRAGYRVAIATNQSGLSRGYFTLDELEAIHQKLCQLVENLGGQIAGIFYCPHLPEEGCACRKPAIGLLEAIGAELGESLEGVTFIGDSMKDLLAGQAAGCRPMLVTTGKGKDTWQALLAGHPSLAKPRDIPVFADLASAARAILNT